MNSLCQEVAGVMGYPLKKATNREWNQPKKKKCVAVNRDIYEYPCVPMSVSLCIHMCTCKYICACAYVYTSLYVNVSVSISK